MKKEFKGFIVGIILASILMSSVVFSEGIRKSIDVVVNSVNLTVNGNKVNADTILYNGTTYVPLRSVAEMLGKEVGWDGNSNTASINDKGFVNNAVKQPIIQTTSNNVSAPTMFNYNVNSADGVTLTWMAENLSGKTINYYTLKISTYNSVGDPSYDQINGKSVFYQKYVGPVQPGETMVMFNIFTYQSALNKIVIDEITFEFSDGTKATQSYGYSTTDSSGMKSN